jgi:hypothetical protein
MGRGIAEVFAGDGADVAVNDFDCGNGAEAVAHWVRGKGRAGRPREARRVLSLGLSIQVRPIRRVSERANRAWRT